MRATLYFTRYLKLVTHINSGWIYHLYRNQAAAAYLSLYFFIFLSLQFSNNNFFYCIFRRKWERVETWYTREQCVMLLEWERKTMKNRREVHVPGCWGQRPGTCSDDKVGSSASKL